MPNSCLARWRAVSVTLWPYEESSERYATRSSLVFLPRRWARCLAMNSTLYQPNPVPSISVRNTFLSPRRVSRGSTQDVSQ